MKGINPVFAKDFIGKKVNIIAKYSNFYNETAIIDSIENYYTVRLRLNICKNLLFLWEEIEVIE